MSELYILDALLIAFHLPWIIAGWLRIYHYARYFQLEGYEFKRYWLWLTRNPTERRYLSSIAVAVVVVEIIGSLILSLLRGAEWVLPLILLSAILARAAFISAPRDRAAKQQFTPTQRAIRLLVTAFLVELALPVLAFYATTFWTLPVYDLPTQQFLRNFFLFLLLFGIGPLTYALVTFFALPLANVINYPIEEAFRQFYLARARRYLKRSGATVIAITGSYGKTTTKHYLNHILDGRFRVLMTPKSYNTLLGISRVINDVLAKDVSYDYFIAETDAYFVGENAKICKLVQPTIGMIMTVGPMHLERLGSMEAIAAAQYEVAQALPPDGACFFNGDDPVVLEMAKRGYPQTAQIVSQKAVPGAHLEAINVRMTKEGLDFDVRDNNTGESRSMHAPLYGEHNVTNIIMAAAVAHHLGMSLAEIALRMTTLEPAEHRLIRRVQPDGTVLIDDTYSANPVGTQTALGVLALHHDSPRRIVVSSGMFELGERSAEENGKLGERMAAVATDVILIGAAQTQDVKTGLERARFPADHLHVVTSFNEAIEVYKGILQPGDALLMLTDLPDTYA